ncbi:hypothetical protein OOU_Y34scaffold00763g6 [Pyricularia oryzae Y34]|uniref:Transcription factor domain-containing protein n=1 Tax=Pyricularia oryzae (strain Y34) TaxID=1143189 RepID=A0AA97PH91_PYRO3|nr:hypothetical protein OOU_Y34scaffold00763g6 [Pyricularia oryzae Y34]
MPRIFNQAAWCARYFHHYITSIAPWYDLSDGSQHFATRLPELALASALPFAAVVALAAIQISQTTAPSARAAAEYYHDHCVRLLLARLKDDNAARGDGDGDGDGNGNGNSNSNGITLASICLLRSYEILSEEVDPNRHLRGAYSLAVSRRPLLREGDLGGRGGLRGAGFWNYLREDITFSLFQRCPLKMGLDQVELFVWRGDDADGDHAYLNAVSLILGRIINECFGRETLSPEAWDFLFRLLRDWCSALLGRFAPFAREERRLGLALPSVWMLHDCHEASQDVDQCTTREEILERCAVEICGIAFTANSPPVVVNCFGPIAFCGPFIRDEAAQQELVRRLMACKRTIGWPVQRLVADLQLAWGEAAGQQIAV